MANEHSIAFGCAAKLRGFGAEVALTYLNEKAKPYVEPLAQRIDADMLLPLDVTQPGSVAMCLRNCGHSGATWTS